MRQLLLGGAALAALAVTLASGEATDTRYLTQAGLPTDQQLGSLGLRKLWHGHVPTGSARDHLVKVQVFGNLLVAETAGGGIIGMDAETGQVLWQQRFAGVTTGAGLFAGANQNHVLVVADNKLIALDRKTGSADWSIYVPHLPTANVVADETHAYYSAANGELISFAIPLTRSQMLNVHEGTLSAESVTTKPQWSWGMRLMTALEHPPVLLNDRLILPQREGNVVILHRDKGVVAERMHTFGPLAAPMATAENDLYIGSLDCSISAVEMTQDGPIQRWRYSGTGRIMQKALAAGNDVFSVDEEGGLACLDRQTGAPRWKQVQVKQIISANQRALIAMDRQGNLRAFDRRHGVNLGSWNAQGYRLPVSNEQTDRVYLANHDGLLVALRDVSPQHDQPIVHFPPKAKMPTPVEVITEAPEIKRLTKTAAQPENGNDSATKSEEKKDK